MKAGFKRDRPFFPDPLATESSFSFPSGHALISLAVYGSIALVIARRLPSTRQRVVLYDALTKSLKTAQQQDVAHRINEIGVKTDQEAQTAMAGIGAATNDRMADMLEAHGEHMVFARKVLEEKARADERFARRFAEIVEKHDKNLYGGQ